MPGARVASGDGVTLRTVESEDVAFLQRASANPEIRYPLGNPLRNREAIDVSDEDGTDRFLVCLEGEERTPGEGASRENSNGDDDAGPGRPDEDDVRRIGEVTVNDADWRRPELGYWLVPAVHGEGYGTEAVSLVIDYVFRTYAHPAVGAIAYEFNEASHGLLESLGFSEEGRVRRDRFIDGEYVDTIRYSLLREEWRDGS